VTTAFAYPMHGDGRLPRGPLGRVPRHLDPGDDGRNLRPADPDIGKRAVVERHQLVIGALAAPPIGYGAAGGDKQVDQRHGPTPAPIMVHCTNWVPEPGEPIE